MWAHQAHWYQSSLNSIAPPTRQDGLQTQDSFLLTTLSLRRDVCIEYWAKTKDHYCVLGFSLNQGFSRLPHSMAYINIIRPYYVSRYKKLYWLIEHIQFIAGTEALIDWGGGPGGGMAPHKFFKNIYISIYICIKFSNFVI